MTINEISIKMTLSLQLWPKSFLDFSNITSLACMSVWGSYVWSLHPSPNLGVIIGILPIPITGSHFIGTEDNQAVISATWHYQSRKYSMLREGFHKEAHSHSHNGIRASAPRLYFIDELLQKEYEIFYKIKIKTPCLVNGKQFCSSWKRVFAGAARRAGPDSMLILCLCVYLR